MVSLNAVYKLLEYKVGYVTKSFIDTMTQQRQLAENDITTANERIQMIKEEGLDKEAEEELLKDTQKLKADATARKAFYKLQNNSVSGKTFQNDTKFTESKFVQTPMAIRLW